MTSDKKAEANRRNAQKSTGPKTPEGKANVRHNAIKHGLLAENVLLWGDDPEEYRELGESLRADLRPEGETEEMLLQEIIDARWRMRRCRQVEAGTFNSQVYSASSSVPVSNSLGATTIGLLGQIFMHDANHANAFSKLSRYETAIERSFYRALHELERRQAARRTEGSVPPPLAVDVDISGVSKEDL